MREEAIQSSFAAGEISPDLDARGDVEFYLSACRELRNALVKPQGGALRRGGTRYVAEIKDSSQRTDQIPFEYSVTQAYMLQKGDRYMRFFKDKAAIVVANTDAAISNGTMTGSLTGWTDRDTGSGVSAHDGTNNRMSLTPGGTASTDIAWREQAVSVGASFQSAVHVLVFRVIAAAGDFIQCRIGTTSTGSELVADRKCHPGWHAVSFTPGTGTVYVQFRNQGSSNNDFTSLDKNIQVDDVSLLDNAALEIATPYLQADLFNADGMFMLKWTQSADVLYLTMRSYKPYKLNRLGHDQWQLEEFAFEDGPYYDENTTATTLTPGAATGAGVTVTASSVLGINRDRGFLTTDVGRIIRVKEGSTYGWGIIVGRTSTTVVTVDIRTTWTNTNAKATWALGLYSDTTGWPACPMFFEERLKFAGHTDRPNRWDGSASGDFEAFTPGTGDGDAVAFTIASDQVNAIRWMAPANKLILGTLGAEFAAGAGGSIDGVITPTNVNVKLQTRHGVADLQPALIGNNAILFLQRQGRKLREIAFEFEADSYVSEEMTLRAEHLTRGGIIGLAWQQEPFGILWCVRKDGRLLGFTYLRKQAITAWHQHPIGGGNDGDIDDATQAIVESVRVIPGPTTTDWGEDQVWLIVRRTLGGSTKRYQEILEPPLHDMADRIESFYVDSGLTYDGAVSQTLTPGAGATVKGTENVTFTAGGAVFSSGDVDREIRYHVDADPEANPPQPAIEGRAKITAYDSGTQVRCTILGAFPSTAAIASGAWRMSVTQVSGATHLASQEVQILTDGAVHPPKVVSAGGVVTLDYPATYVHLGLPFSTRLRPVKFANAGGSEGTAQGKKKRIAKVGVRLKRSLGMKLGYVKRNTDQTEEDKLDAVAFRDYGGQMDMPPALFTGDKDVNPPNDYKANGDILVVQDEPLPLHVLALMPTVVTAEGG